MSSSRLEIDLSAVQRNVTVLRAALEAARTAPPSQPADPAEAPAVATPPAARAAICGVIKQDGYGLGAPRIAKKLAALGVEMLAVYDLDEARALTEAPIQTPILILSPIRTIERQDPVYRLAVRGRLHLVAHDLPQIADLANIASRLGVRLPLHVQLDSGLGRGGALDAEARQIVETVAAHPRLLLAGLMTHFSAPASDEPFTREQAKLFKAWVQSLKPILQAHPAALTPIVGGPVVHPHMHAANTVAMLRARGLHGSMVRVGQGLYGYGFESFTDPLAVEFASFGKQLQPAVRWLSKIVHIHEVPKGSAVGYNRTFKAQRPTRVALVPVGYADGYPIGLSNTGKVNITGQQWDRSREGLLAGGSRVEILERPAFAPVIGRVSMDQITIDVTGLPDNLARIGAEVELIGKDPQAPNHLPTLAKAAGTITHEMLCRIAPKVERAYSAGAQPNESGGGQSPMISASPRLAAGAV